MHDRQHLFHLQYTTKIYAEDVIVTESRALVRMTAQAAQSCEAQALLHLCRNKSLGRWETLNIHVVLFWLLLDPGIRQPQPRSLLCTTSRLRYFVLSEAFAFSWKNRSLQHLQIFLPLVPIRDLFVPSMTPFRTKPLRFCPMETKMMGLEERTYADLILLLNGVNTQIQELKNAASSHSTFSSLKDTFSSLSHLGMAHIVSKSPS